MTQASQSIEVHSKHMFLYSEDLHSEDMMNYFATELLEMFLESIPISSSALNCLDVGIGFGGPSRVLAHKYGYQINGIEFSDDNAKVCEYLNEITGLAEKINVVVVDVTKLDFDGAHAFLKESHDIAISMLALLHIPNKSKVYSNISQAIKKNGYLYCEDYFIQNGFQATVEDKFLLENRISIPNGFVLSQDEYAKLLEENGFEIVEFADITAASTAFVWRRYRNFLEKKASLAALYGDAWVASQEEFYKSIAIIFRENRDITQDEYYKPFLNIGELSPTSHIRCCKIIARKLTG